VTSITGPFARNHDLTSPVVARDDAASQQSQAVAAAASVPDGYWLNDMSGKGIAAFNSNPNGYKVFRNVKEYGAKGK
jgi:glucan 1,3-beta-glucosidase